MGGSGTPESWAREGCEPLLLGWVFWVEGTTSWGALETPVERGGVEWALLSLCWARTGAEVERGFFGARGAQVEC